MRLHGLERGELPAELGRALGELLVVERRAQRLGERAIVKRLRGIAGGATPSSWTRRAK